ncbi:MAG: hypothetical protein AAFO96_29615, partial [Bacteroidota bacterium]
MEVTGINNTTVVDTAVTAEYVVQNDQGEEIILICGEMIYHPQAWTTLHSFSQIEAAGHTIRTKNGARIELDCGEIVPLCTQGGLYKLRYRCPTYEERMRLPTFVLTEEGVDHRQTTYTTMPQIPKQEITEKFSDLSMKEIQSWRAKLMLPSDERLSRTLQFSILYEPTYIASGEDPTHPVHIRAKPHKGWLKLQGDNPRISHPDSGFL